MTSNFINASARQQYCILLIFDKFWGGDKEINVVFGERNQELITDNAGLIAETLKVKDYFDLVDALNYMSMIGWQIDHILPMDTNHDGGKAGPLRYLMHRPL
ncbi:hypothetical protein [Mucilaginibacter myungsuensis]|uniref:Uncharacterized protein n=1 Tax=Mucilaginibacter myungsuensis TaxID=649104 RepID=A0A929KYB5_9SPHI|nr:hypothetical protein [Mucilaginibacter myungsuensis]MBE9662897.1 hypothetical protein [Mucilaginibacter myungsuensis]MDN3598517.1 hypothetical protein [Mucilaginibacter myungsuensis]